MGRGYGCMVPLILIVLVLLFNCSAAQECLDGCTAGLSTCESIDYKLYITNATDINGTEAAIQKLFYQANNLGMGSKPCRAALSSLLCNVLHPSCDGSIATPIAPCVDLCYDFVASCSKYAMFFPDIIRPYLNCSGVDPKTKQPLFSSNTCSFSKNTSTIKCPNNPKPHVLPFTGVCAPFVPDLAPLNQKAVCSPFVTKKVWLSNDWSNWQYFMGLSNIYYPIVQNAKTIMPQGCFQRLTQYQCAHSCYSPCIDVFVPEYNTTVGIKPHQCYSMCQDISDHCDKFYDEIELPVFKINCSASLDLYSVNSTYRFYITDDIYYDGQCLDYMFPPDPVAPYVYIDVDECPLGTGKKSQRGEKLPPCGLKCPDMAYSDKEWDRLVVITQIGSSLSFISMMFLIVSYLLQFERRKFPASMHIWEFIATAGFAVAFLIGGKNPKEQTWCYDEGSNATQENSARCGTQGFLFIFFGLSLSLWCCNIAFSMFYGIVLNKKVSLMERYWSVFHILGWGVPLIFAIAAVASKSVGYGPPLAWCFIHFAGFGFGEGSTSRDYPLFYIPEGILFFIILALFVITVAKIIRLQNSTQFSVGNKKEVKKHARTFKAQIRLLIFIFIVGVICVSIFEWRLQIDGDDVTSVTGIRWTYCKIKDIIKLPNFDTCPGDVNPARINYTHTAFESFLLSGIGILIFIGFGSDPLLYKHWVKIVTLLVNREFQQLREFVVHGVDPFPSSTNIVTRTSNNTNSNTTNSPSNSRNSSTSVSVQAVSVLPVHPMSVDSS